MSRIRLHRSNLATSARTRDAVERTTLRERHGSIPLDLAALIALPIAVFLVAWLTEIGPTLLIFGWDHGSEGLHLGDLVALALALPLWLAALAHLIRTFRPR